MLEISQISQISLNILQDPYSAIAPPNCKMLIQCHLYHKECFSRILTDMLVKCQHVSSFGVRIFVELSFTFSREGLGASQ